MNDKSPKQSLQSYVSECCTNSSIHGCKFLGEKNRSIFERVFWFAVLVTCLFFCITLILEAYYKWQVSPVVVSFATSETPVWKIPFPAVTICPEVKTQKSLVNFTDLVLIKKRGGKLNREQIKQFNYMLEICSNVSPNAEETFDFLSEDFYDFLFNVQPTFTDTIDECFWAGKNCTDEAKKIFSPLVTTDGFCFSFNLLDRSDMFSEEVALQYYTRFNISHQPSTNWQLEEGYKLHYDKVDMPRRTSIAGISGGLQITLWVESNNLDYFCGDALQGYKVMLHNPSELPFSKQKYFRVGLNQVVTAAVKPVIVKTSNQLKHYHPKKRQCYFPEERKLRFFKTYGQSNCLHECLSNITNDNCGCVSFDMPRLNTTRICGYGKLRCTIEAIDKFVAIKHSKIDDGDVQDLIEKCDCRQTCSSLNFEAEISQVDWKWQKRSKTLASIEMNTKSPYLYQYTKIQIFFKDLQFISSERNELYGLMDFLSSCGGLLGLFIGFSFISLIELMYFLTIRVICNYKNFKNPINKEYI
ncbi:hypothetical protein RN001_014118 [Aquatica leii]|uniref:Uncharacterized protein n=1 Tax=Aquatica leii TaxID=1421715 RepID=A0AAN7QDP2_9COLE|nr:hypothetical protein RN001_014118 [Aquatica leii]